MIELKKTKRPVTELVWHCTATPAERPVTVDQIRDWHKARGWSDIGYHYIVHLDGRIEAGRPIDKIGAHVGGRNTGTIGAVYVGGIEKDKLRAADTRTKKQKAAMLWLTERLAEMYNLRQISGHNEYANKARPSFNVRNAELGNIPGYRKGKKL